MRRLIACLPAVLVGCVSGDAPASDALAFALDTVSTIGVLDGPPEQTLGRIIDVVAALDGSVFVLDAQPSLVRWYGPDGEYRGGVTAQGQGPGELSRAVGVALMGDELGVLDPRNGRLAVYRTGESGIEHRTAFAGVTSTFDAVRSLCALGDRWYVRSRRSGRMLHAFDTTGAPAASFDPEASLLPELFGEYTDIVGAQISGGQLACVEEPATIATIAMFTSVVRAYTPDGELRWERELADIRPLRFVVGDGGRPTLSEPEPGGSHLGRSVVAWGDEALLVQYGVDLGDAAPEGADPPVVSIALSLADGSELGRTEALPLIADTEGDRVYAFVNEPYPRVIVMRMR